MIFDIRKRMSCIFYQDELGVCCINGLDWSDGFRNNPKCLEDQYDEKTCDRGKITVTDAREMKKKLEAIRSYVTELLRHNPDDFVVLKHVTADLLGVLDGE